MSIVFSHQNALIAIAIGIVVSMLWYERKNLSPGGVIVPGLVALYLVTDPLLVFYTLVTAFLAMLVVRTLSNYVILFGRRRFSTVMLVSFGIAWALEAVTQQFQSLSIGFQVIGFIAPGLVANEMGRQGTLNTLYTLSAISIVTLLLLLVLIGWSW
jgi:poly-gamma-glutamate biosynthesis protein PgsC/CapC